MAVTSYLLPQLLILLLTCSALLLLPLLPIHSHGYEFSIGAYVLLATLTSQ